MRSILAAAESVGLVLLLFLSHTPATVSAGAPYCSTFAFIDNDEPKQFTTVKVEEFSTAPRSRLNSFPLTR